MSEIPEDVMRDASKWTAQCYQPETGTWFDVRDIIARAILAERKRCAEVVRELPDRRYSDYDGWVTVPPSRKDFVKAIEAGA